MRGRGRARACVRVCARVRACVRVRAWVCVCVGLGFDLRRYG